MALQILAREETLALPRPIEKCFLLAPTLKHIGRAAPCHLRVLSQPLVRPAAVAVVGSLVELIPRVVFQTLLRLFTPRGTPANVLDAVCDMMSSKRVLNSALTLARTEFDDILDLDESLIVANKERLVFVYSSHDPWVPQSHFEDMKELLPQHPKGSGLDCMFDVPHAFSLVHSDLIADYISPHFR